MQCRCVIGNITFSVLTQLTLCRKNENQSNEAVASEEGIVEPRTVMQNSVDSEILGDGFRWRKYGQKVVKGNPYPRFILFFFKVTIIYELLQDYL